MTGIDPEQDTKVYFQKAAPTVLPTRAPMVRPTGASTVLPTVEVVINPTEYMH